MTLGRREQRDPDPALQPLIALTSRHYAITPNLIINGSSERNFMVLLNRLPDEKAVYARLSNDRERNSRDQAIVVVAGLGLRHWHGEIPQWGDRAEIDLVVISDFERCCLVLEMKAFIGPADPREVHEIERNQTGGQAGP